MKPLIPAARPRGPDLPSWAATFETDVVAGVVVCRITGDVDIDSAPAASHALLQALQRVRSPRELFADLAGVDFFSAAGLDVLLRLGEAATAGRVPLVLLAPSPAVLRVLELSGTLPLFTIRPRLWSVPALG